LIIASDSAEILMQYTMYQADCRAIARNDCYIFIFSTNNIK